MDRVIFELDLGVEPTSLYILICSKTVNDKLPTLNLVRSFWNGTEEALQQALEVLCRRGILANSLPIDAEEPLQVTSRQQWVAVGDLH